VKVVLFVSVLSFVIFEAVATEIDARTAEGSAQDVARASAVAYLDANRFAAAEEAALGAADEREVELIDPIVDGEEVVATVRAQARTLLIRGIGPVDDVTVREATRTVERR
jgi:hypothetical protein